MSNLDKDEEALKWWNLVHSSDWEVVVNRIQDIEKKNADLILKLSRTPSVDTGIQAQCIASQTEALKQFLRYAISRSSKVNKGE